MAGEWLLTNGLGGYAMGALEGPPSRGYHGFLVAATRPPDGRTLLVGPVETWLEVDGAAVRLDTLEVAPGLVEAEPPPSFATFETALTMRWPDLRDVSVELRAWMIRDANATVMRWRRLDGDATRHVRLALTPLVACRDHHPADVAPEPTPDVAVIPGPQPAVEVRWGGDRPILRMAASGGTARRVERRVSPSTIARTPPAAPPRTRRCWPWPRSPRISRPAPTWSWSSRPTPARSPTSPRPARPREAWARSWAARMR